MIANLIGITLAALVVSFCWVYQGRKIRSLKIEDNQNFPKAQKQMLDKLFRSLWVSIFILLVVWFVLEKFLKYCQLEF